MAPAAWDTIMQNFRDFDVDEGCYDKIITGDLGEVGRKILLKRLKEEGIELPVVLCSSIRYRIPEMAGCIRYREGETWELKQDFREIINRIMQ